MKKKHAKDHGPSGKPENSGAILSGNDNAAEKQSDEQKTDLTLHREPTSKISKPTGTSSPESKSPESKELKNGQTGFSLESKSPELKKPKSEKAGSSTSFFKIIFSLILLGAAGLAGFWSLTQMKQGTLAVEVISDLRSRVSVFDSNQKEISQAISDLKTKVSVFESNQEEIIKILNTVGSSLAEIVKSNKILEGNIPDTKLIVSGLEPSQNEIKDSLNGIGSSLDQIIKSSETVSEIPDTLKALDEKLTSMGQIVSEIPQILATIEESGPSSADIELEMRAMAPVDVITQEGGKIIIPVEKVQKIIKILYIKVGEGLNWSMEKLEPAISVIKEQIKHILTLLKLEDFLKKYISTFGGEHEQG